LLIAALLIVFPFILSGYALPKLIVLSLAVFTLRGRRFDSMDFPLKLLWLVLLAGTVFSIDPYQSFAGRYNDWGHGLIGAAVLTLWILKGNGEEPDTDSLARAALVFSALAVMERMATGERARGLLGDPVATGSLLALACPLVVHERRRWLPLLAAGLWATGSRGAWAASLLGLLAW